MDGPEEGAQGEEVADLLVGDGAEPDRRVPHRRRLAQEPAGVEIEVALVVRVGDPGLRPQLRHEGEEGERQMLDPRLREPPRRSATDGPRSPAGTAVLGAVRLNAPSPLSAWVPSGTGQYGMGPSRTGAPPGPARALEDVRG